MCLNCRAMSPGDDPSSAPEMRIGEDGLAIKNVDNIRVVDPDTGEVYFDFLEDEVIKLSGEYDSISADTVEADGIFAPLGKDLFIKSDAGMHIQGSVFM